MTEGDLRASPYANWHPHFTPRWLSTRIASRLASSFTGTVVDPTCGAGNLLAAAASRTGATSRVATELAFLGIDSSRRSVRECKQTLTDLLPARNFRITQANFLRMRALPIGSGPVALVMNPPFKGYGRLSARSRLQAVKLCDMKGRYNLAHVFIAHAMKIFDPEVLIALLPSNWVYSRSSAFRGFLDGSGGAWEWEDVGDEAFEGVSAHVGVLVWRRGRSGPHSNASRSLHRLGDLHGVVVHHGVATGCDKAFEELAQIRIPFGKRMRLVRGRDVAREAGGTIWVPPASRTSSTDLGTRFRGLVPRRLVDALRSRSCVRQNGRKTYEYHEVAPAWFMAGPKVLLPEIVCGGLRVAVDGSGSKLPLHSVVAIKVPTVAAGRLLKALLHCRRRQRRLLERAPRLSGGAFRLQVGAVKDISIPRSFLRKWKEAMGGREHKVRLPVHARTNGRPA